MTKLLLTIYYLATSQYATLPWTEQHYTALGEGTPVMFASEKECNDKAAFIAFTHGGGGRIPNYTSPHPDYNIVAYKCVPAQ